jgi:hypothetical protein
MHRALHSPTHPPTHPTPPHPTTRSHTLPQMMDPEASRRPSAEQLLRHTWIMQHVSLPDLPWLVAAPAPISTNTMPGSPSAVYAKKEMMAPVSPTAAGDTIPAYMPSGMSHGPSSGELHSLMKTPTGLDSSEPAALALALALPVACPAQSLQPAACAAAAATVDPLGAHLQTRRTALLLHDKHCGCLDPCCATLLHPSCTPPPPRLTSPPPAPAPPAVQQTEAMMRRFHDNVDPSVRSGSSMNSAASMMMTSSSCASDSAAYNGYSQPASPVSDSTTVRRLSGRMTAAAMQASPAQPRRTLPAHTAQQACMLTCHAANLADMSRSQPC